MLFLMSLKQSLSSTSTTEVVLVENKFRVVATNGKVKLWLLSKAV
jgi:hypothetical protein